MVPSDQVTSRFERDDERVEVANGERRMSLRRRYERRVDTDMHDDPARRAEPRSPAGGKGRRLGLLGEPEEANPEAMAASSPPGGIATCTWSRERN